MTQLRKLSFAALAVTAMLIGLMVFFFSNHTFNQLIWF